MVDFKILMILQPVGQIPEIKILALASQYKLASTHRWLFPVLVKLSCRCLFPTLIDVGSGHVTCIVHWDVSKNQAGKGLKHAHPRGPALCTSASPWDEHAQQVERHMEQT